MNTLLVKLVGLDLHNCSSTLAWACQLVRANNLGFFYFLLILEKLGKLFDDGHFRLLMIVCFEIFCIEVASSGFLPFRVAL